MKLADEGLPARYVVPAVVSFYFFTSISLVFLNKLMFSSETVGLDAPLFLTWTQIVVAVILCYFMTTYGKANYPSLSFLPQWEFEVNKAIKVMPLTLLFAGMITFNNLCLKHVEVSFYQVARALTIVFNIVLSYAFLGQSTSARSIGACGVVVFGYILGCDGEINFSLKGVIYGVLSSVFVSMYSIYVKKIMNLLDDNQWLLMIYNNVNAMLLMPIVVVLMSEHLELVRAPQVREFDFWFVTCVTGVFGFMINIASFLQIKYTSPLTHNVSGTAKAGVQTVLGVFIWQNPVSTKAGLGTAITIFGCGLYGYVRHMEKKPSPPSDAKQSELSVLKTTKHGGGTVAAGTSIGKNKHSDE